MNLKPTRTTIKEVAAAAGVSTMTVSRVLNDRPDVSAETRKRVKQIIDEMEYQPSALARSLIQQRSYTLGVVTAGLKHIGPSRMLNGITQIAEEAGYSLLLKELSHYHMRETNPIFQELLSRHVDGILWAVPEIGDNHEWINQLTLPLETPVVFLTMEPRENLTTVSVDNYQGGRLIMAHLLEQGYQHIGHISGPLDWWESRQRMAAWRDALVENGCPIKDEYWAEGNWSPTSGAEAAEKLFVQYPDMDAIFVGNDQMALSVLYIAHKRGYSMPDTLGVAGFDNIPEAAYFYPPLTTVQQAQYEVARVAMQEMIQAIEAGWQGEEPPSSQALMISPTLVTRESTLRKP
ncbi:MAG TPA: LacI family DNA-binding transcriptional regulator [Anaerolineales bacterium]|nr:LacI family DNA-binding transcriptional regulator [Anaerolineales bacterium]